MSNKNSEISVSEQNICINCNTDNSVSAKFCNCCGQGFIQNDTVKGFLVHFLSDYFAFDSKIVKTYFPLLFKPGFLTVEFMSGKRATYIPPIRIYIFVSILFFIALSFGANQASISYDEIDSLNLFWDKFFTGYMPKMFFFLLPVFALFLKLVFSRVRKNFLLDFIFSLHFHAFVFAAFLIYLLLSLVFIKMGLANINQWLILGIFLYILYYLWKSLHEVYGQRKLITLVKGILLIILYVLVMGVISLGVLYVMTL